MRRGQHQVITILGTESTLASLIPCLEAIRKAVYNLRNFSMYQRIFLGVSNVVPNRLDECLKLPSRIPSAAVRKGTLEIEPPLFDNGSQVVLVSISNGHS
jgi:hypothetical protein